MAKAVAKPKRKPKSWKVWIDVAHFDNHIRAGYVSVYLTKGQSGLLRRATITLDPVRRKKGATP